MYYEQKKLQRNDAEKLNGISISAWKPFAILPAPVYVYLRKNKKFISLKGPLDYFTPEELEKLSGYEMLFFPNTILYLNQFLEISRAIRRLLEWDPTKSGKSPLGLSAYELSDAVLGILSPVWVKSGFISPVVVTLFVDQLLGPLDPAILTGPRETDLVQFETELLRSSWVIFLLLNLGYCEIQYLRKLWVHLILSGCQVEKNQNHLPDVSTAIEIAKELISSPETGAIPILWFEQRTDRFCERLNNRLKRAKSEFSQHGLEELSVDILFGGEVA